MLREAGFEGAFFPFALFFVDEADFFVVGFLATARLFLAGAEDFAAARLGVAAGFGFASGFAGSEYAVAGISPFAIWLRRIFT